MKDLINKIIRQIAEENNTEYHYIEILAFNGSFMAFKDDLITRIDKFGENFFDENNLYEFVNAVAGISDALLLTNLIDSADKGNTDLNDVDDKLQQVSEELFNKMFKSLPVLYNVNGFEIRDINKLDRDISFIDQEISDLSEILIDFFNEMFDDGLLYSKLEKICQITVPISKFEIREKISSFHGDETDIYLDDNEFYIKFKYEAKDLLNGIATIFNEYWSNAFHLIQNYPFITKSLFISFYHKEYHLDLKGWKEIISIISPTT